MAAVMAGELSPATAGSRFAKIVERQFVVRNATGNHQGSITIIGIECVLGFKAVCQCGYCLMAGASKLKPTFTLALEDSFPAVSLAGKRHNPQKLHQGQANWGA